MLNFVGNRERADNQELGLEHLERGNHLGARQAFSRAVEVTPEMAQKLIKILKKRGIRFVVAPYEADAQLAYLAKCGTVDFVISEDSDCLVYGCEKVGRFFKMKQ